MAFFEGFEKAAGLKEDVADFLVRNPNPDDGKFHQFAEEKKVSPHKLEAVAYQLATERAKELRKSAPTLPNH